MKRLSRDSWLALLLIVLFLGVTALAIYQEALAAAQAPPLSTYSNQPTGARALKLYLDEVGFDVQNPKQTRFDIPSRYDLVLMLAPQTAVNPAEWRVLDEWVEAGGTLLIVGDDIGSNSAFGHYDFRLRYTGDEATAVSLQIPLLTSPAIPDDAELTTTYALQSSRDDYVTHFATEEEGWPVVVSWPMENGRIILSSAPFPFSNAGLQQPANAEWALSLLNSADEPQNIFFDEWHHGLRDVASENVITPTNWLRRTPGGRAVLYVALVLFIGLILQGRIFGRPLPMTKTLARRAPLEYINGIANLSRRAGHRQAALLDYHHRLKRDLGHRYRLNPTLPDAEFVRQLAEYDTAVNPQELLQLLNQLKNASSEQDMVQAATAAAEFGKEEQIYESN